MAKVVKRFPHKLVRNHAQVKDKCEERKKKYITKKKIGVIENAPSKWCWFDCIDKILASIEKVDNLPKGLWGM